MSADSRDEAQRVEERRRIRDNYQRLIRESDEPRQASAIVRHLRAGNELFAEVTTTQESSLDSKFLSKTVDIASAGARKLKLGQQGVEIEEFLEKIVEYMRPEAAAEDGGIEAGGRGVRWARLGKYAWRHMRRVPTTDFMLGPLALERRARAPAGTQRPRRERLDYSGAGAVRPDEVHDLAGDLGSGTSATTRNVLTIYHTLQRVLASSSSPRVNMFRFFVDPGSFAKTVENLFHLSFLLRDGKVGIGADDASDTGDAGDDGPYLELREPAGEDASGANGGSARGRQAIMSLDMETWQQLVDLYHIDHAMIPDLE